MSATSDRINALLERVLPIVLGLIVLAFGYYWLVQPAIADYLKSRSDMLPLEARVRFLEDRVARGRGVAWPDEAEPLRLFEDRVSKDNRVADVVERLTRAIAESTTDGRLRNLAMGTGDEPATDVSSGQVRPATAAEGEKIDPRWSLFPYNLTHATITLSFDASYGTITSFFSKVRDLPTAIEIRSVKLTRGLPLMNVQAKFFVFRRGDILPGAGVLGPSQSPTGPPDGLRPNPLAPRTVVPGRSGD